MGPWEFWVSNRTKMKSPHFSSAGFVDLCARPAKCVFTSTHSGSFSAWSSNYSCRNRTMEALWRYCVNRYPRICSFCPLSANPLSRLNSWTSCPKMNIASDFSQLNESTSCSQRRDFRQGGSQACPRARVCLKLHFSWRWGILLIPFHRKSIMQTDSHYSWILAGNYGILLLGQTCLTVNSYSGMKR